jgi:hypothetical protein
VVADDPTRDLAAVRNVRYTITGGRLIDWASFDSAMGPGWFQRNDSGA